MSSLQEKKLSTENQLINSIKAKINIIQLISYETLRIHGFVINASNETKKDLYRWNRIEGLFKWNDTQFDVEDEEMKGADQILEHYKEELNNSVLLLEDFHPDLSEENVTTIRRLRNIALDTNSDNTLVLSQPTPLLPKEMEKEVHIIDIDFPDKEDIKSIYEKVCLKYNINKNENEPDDILIESALGLTIMEVEKSFSMAYIQDDELTERQVHVVIKEKESIIQKSGYLEYYHPKDSMSDIGGLDELKKWLDKRRRGFDKDAQKFGLETPKGILMLGVPGTGKSLTAKAIGSDWQFPLLRLDMGKIFGGIVGESEHNMREALKIAEAISPSILWIDEIEKGMSGMSSSGSTDGGTTARVLGTFLTWMQEKKKPVFVVATANNIAQLPPELLRKGRVDEIFFVDLPNKNDREEIFKIHLKRKGRIDSDFNLDELADKSRGFSGAEIEEAIKEGLFQAYDEEEELNDKHILESLKNTFPLSKTMEETISDMRKWAKSRAKMASSGKFDSSEDDVKLKDAIPQLKQEAYNNPFIKKN